jgi:hypothetical protein
MEPSTKPDDWTSIRITITSEKIIIFDEQKILFYDLNSIRLDQSALLHYRINEYYVTTDNIILEIRHVLK